MVRYPSLLETHFGVPKRQLVFAVLKPLTVGITGLGGVLGC